MRFKEILKEKGLTSKELAERLGMSQTGLSIALGKDGNPSLKRLEQIASALGVPVWELFASREEIVAGFLAVVWVDGAPMTFTDPITLENFIADYNRRD